MTAQDLTDATLAGVGYPSNSQPHISWKHIDGPMLTCRSGRIHWLTLWERLMYKLGREDVYSLERKHLHG